MRTPSPRWDVSWPDTGGPYYKVSVGPQGAETPYGITAALGMQVLVPPGQCIEVHGIDVNGVATTQSAEACPPAPNAPGLQVI